jgi:hypothetical protein
MLKMLGNEFKHAGGYSRASGVKEREENINGKRKM